MDALTDFDGMARTFPLMRGGGALLVLVGLGLLCIVNAGLGLLVPEIPYRVLWVTDGVLKVAAGSTMVWLSY